MHQDYSVRRIILQAMLICSDSQADIKALSAICVSGHTGVLGNEEAD